MSFKPGDQVVCINPDYDGSIQYGAVYTVANSKGDHDHNWVALEGIVGYRFTSRFRLAEEKDMSMAHRLSFKATKAKQEIDAKNKALAETQRKAAEQERLQLSRAFSKAFESHANARADLGKFDLDLDFREAIAYGEDNVRKHLQLEGFTVKRERRDDDHYDEDGNYEPRTGFILVAYWNI